MSKYKADKFDREAVRFLRRVRRQQPEKAQLICLVGVLLQTMRPEDREFSAGRLPGRLQGPAEVKEAYFRGDAWTEPEQDEDDEQWFRERRWRVKERVRPATVAEQVWMFETTGGAIHENIRITHQVVFAYRTICSQYEKYPA